MKAAAANEAAAMKEQNFGRTVRNVSVVLCGSAPGELQCSARSKFVT